MPSVRKTKRRPSITKWAKIVALACAVIAIGFAFLGLYLKQQEVIAANAAEAAKYDPASAPDAGSPTSSAEPAEPVSAWFSGDSLTAGWHAATEADAFPALVDSKLGEGITDTTSTARAGATLQEVATDFDVPSGVGLIVVELGTNDAAQGTDPAVFAEQYAAYLDEIREVNPDAELVCLGVWFLSSQPQTVQLDRAIQDSCAAHDGMFKPLSDIIADPAMRGPGGVDTWVGVSDTFHPNNAGHARIAARVLEAIR